ncbi:MAG: single-stranded DNA-binding protein [Victivallaceae bacterium]|nr:single-stranded DNA-binding protein [Victivallaceae bacterium]
MAASYNKVLLMGNLTRNPELRTLSGGSSVCEFGMAMNRRFTVNGQERNETTFVDIVVWGRSAESCARFLTKGSPVFIEGRLQLDQWEDQQGGKRSRLRVVADNVQFIGARRDGTDDGQYGQGQGQGGYQGRQGYDQPPRQSSGPGGYRGNTAVPPNAPGGRSIPGAPPVPDEAFNVGDEVEDDIPF